MAGDGNGDGTGREGFRADLASLGFTPQQRVATNSVVWSLAFNSYLTFTLHEFPDHVLFSWVFDLGEYVEERGWVLGSGETSFHELYPRRDVRLAAEVRSVEAEITRTLAQLRLDLGAPGL